ncbi:MAG: hypothetical protein M1135_02005 [Candidatus Omnitrophica bacterium]|nr:hypothetical protein [Candidatus Omnitrophota bacterium]
MGKIINKAILESISSFKIYSLSIDLYDQTYAIFPCADPLLKKVPENIKFITLPKNIIVTETIISGIDSYSGTSSILFYPDGTQEPAEIFVTDLSENKNYEIILKPYSLSPEVSSYE